MKSIPQDYEEHFLRSDVVTQSLDVLLVFNILHTHNKINPYIEKELRNLKMTSSQFNLLLLLFSHGGQGIPLSEIGRMLVVTKANITGLIDRLEEKGLVVRDGSSDRRVTLAKLTDSGIQLVKEMIPEHNKLLSDLVDYLTQGEKKQLIALLSKMRKGLRDKLHIQKNVLGNK